MFKATDRPRVFALPCGADFPAALVEGLCDRHKGRPPQDMARVHLIVNTRRMARRIRALFDQGPALLLPRIGLVTDLGEEEDLAKIPPAVSPIRRRLEVARLVSQLLESQPDIAPRAALYDLADSLADLMDEMHGEGVPPETIMALDVSDSSGHWRRSLEFLRIVQHYFDATTDAPDKETRQRMVIEAMIDRWKVSPPDHPVIIAGSTGSRGTTALLMNAVSQLPQGALVLPGYDFEMPDSAWSDLDDPLTAEDHPQFRFRKIMRDLSLTPADIAPWSDAKAPNPARNRLISLALRPAPVTDQWLSEGPSLSEIPEAFDNVTLLEATSKREEAQTIALRLRKAAEDGQTAALITPDRMLTRQVSAALDRWNILPDDSAGLQLTLSPPGRYLRHIAALFHRKLTAEDLLILLSHPLTHCEEGRGPHLRLTRELELHIRRKGMPFPEADPLLAWAAAQKDPMAIGWIEWLINCFLGRKTTGQSTLADHLSQHMDLAKSITIGSTPPEKVQSLRLWSDKDGRMAEGLISELALEAHHGGAMSAHDYDDLFSAILRRGEVREVDSPHPKILIWGTLEARVQGADLLILGSLNEGTWPETPAPDPWLNRKMRMDAGLLLPERRIGLSAHDFQQAVAAPEVWLTRSIRSDDAETVPSRWINRLANLLNGLPAQDGPKALKSAIMRGEHWIAQTKKLEEVVATPPAHRPSPKPPLAAMPDALSVTEVKTLIRDPYAIYAKHILRLRPLDPLMKAPDALLRGTVMHLVLERFVQAVQANRKLLSRQFLLEIAESTLAENVPWPEMRALWQARFQRIADWLVEGERARQDWARQILLEKKGRVSADMPRITLTGKADRLDIDAEGRVRIFDYKTGKAPTAPQQKKFEKQLLLEAAMVEMGAFPDIGPSEVDDATFVELGNTPGYVSAPLAEQSVTKVWEEFLALISVYSSGNQGFSSRLAFFKDSEDGYYDQLARFGEWDMTQAVTPEDLT